MKKEEYPIDAFDNFWSIYPHKVAKKAALKAFNNVQGKIGFLELLAAVEAYKEHLAKNSWLHPKQAQGWLNGERWNDQYAQTKSDDYEWRAHKRTQLGPSKYQ